jgi:hypothetical protein
MPMTIRMKTTRRRRKRRKRGREQGQEETQGWAGAKVILTRMTMMLLHYQKSRKRQRGKQNDLSVV